MKPPKEPKSFKWPRMYMRELIVHEVHISLLRIIYPDGRTQVSAFDYAGLDGTFEEAKKCPGHSYGKGCWSVNSKSGKDALKAMREFDKYLSCRVTYLGEIK